MKKHSAKCGSWVLGAACLALAACFGPSPENMVADAKASLEKKDAKTALIHLKNALKEKPGLGEARFLLGKVLLDGGDAASALIEFGKAREAQFSSDEMSALEARALLRRGQVDQLLQQHQATELSSPAAAASLQTSIANALAIKGEIEQARARVERALQLQPGLEAAQLVQVRLVAAGEGLAAGLQAVDALLAKTPASSEGWQAKGEFLMLSGASPDAAIEAFRSAIKHDRTNAAAHESLLALLAARRDWDGMKTALAEFRAVRPGSPQLRFHEAYHAAETGDLKTAREHLQQLLRLAPQDGRVQLLAGAVEYRRGMLAAAEAHLSKAILALPNSSRPRILMARVQLRAGEPTKALAALQPLLDGKRPEAEVLGVAGEARMQLGDMQQAEAHFAKAATLNPQDVRSRTALALAQVGKGQYQQGVDALQRIAEGDVAGISDMALISALSRKGEYDKALSAVDGLARKLANKAVAPNLRGQIESLRGNAAKARAHYEQALQADPLYLPAVRSLAALDVADRQPQQAVKRFENVLAADPANAWARMAIIDLKSKLGVSRAELEKLLQDALKQDADALAPRVALVRFHLQGGNAKAALSLAQEGLAARPDQPELLQVLAQAQAQSGDVNQALLTLNKAVALQPGVPQPLILLAELQLGQKDSAAALQSLKRALAAKPDHLPAQLAMARVLAGMGRIDEALGHARAIQKQRPNENLGLALEGDLETQARRHDKAAQAYRASLRGQPSSDLAIRLHQALMAGDAKAQAAAHEAAWLKSHPRDVAFLFYLGDAALVRGDNAAASQHYQAVLAIDAEHAASLNNLAWLLHRQKQAGALEYAEKANKLRPGQPAFMDTLAGILADSGQLSRAISLQKEAVELAPGLAQHRLHLAKFYIQAGQKSAARTELGRLAELGDRFPAHAEVKQLLQQL
jgi:putative PEP-CTERM system TPR-repeat lipoprotein